MEKFIVLTLLFTTSFGVAKGTGRVGLATLIPIVIFFVFFVIQDMGGGHFSEAIQFAIALSIFFAIPCFIVALIGSSLYSKSSGEISNDENQDEQ
jgi:lipopolysaccharide export LptBFGC system permease protein LptF